ncbi:MAG: GerMN domain-containing protein [Candidatus Gracilibacteria bacterium]
MTYFRTIITPLLLLTLMVSCGVNGDNLQSSVSGNKVAQTPAKVQTYDTLTVFFSKKSAVANANDCSAVVSVSERVLDKATPQRALLKLLQGPTAAQQDATSFFSVKTAGLLKSVKIDKDTVYVDFRDMRNIIPNASTSCGSQSLLAQLDTTLKNFPNVKKTIYAIEGSPTTFYEWLQIGCTAENNNCDASAFKPAANQNSNKKGGICIDKCGDNKCQEVVCTGSGCPCPESAKSCAMDCKG